MEKIRAYLGRKWVEYSEKTQILSPITKKPIAEFGNMKDVDIDAAYEFASKIQKQWKLVPRKEKIQVFKNFALLIREHRAEFVNLMMKEIAKSKKDAEVEVDRTVDIVFETIDQFKHLMAGEIFGDLGNDEKIGLFKREPYGVILAISPYNYPINLAITKLVPSLITGNAVVFKSATQGTLTGHLIVKLLYKAGLMPGALQFVTGRGRDIGDALGSNKRIRLINFTGSYSVGQRLASQNPMAKKIFELSGKDAAIIFNDSSVEAAANAIMKGSFSYSGQRCTALKRVLVCKEKHDDLVKALHKKIKKLTISNDVSTSPDIVPVIDASTVNEAKELVLDAKTKGATILIGDKYEGNLVYPTLINHVTKKMRIYYEEQFSPILPIIVFETEEQAIEIFNDSDFGLGGCVFTDNYKKFMRVANLLETGRVTWNNTPGRGPDNFPFVGIKHSGVGMQGAREVLVESTYLKGFVF